MAPRGPKADEYVHRFPIFSPQNAPTGDFALVLVSARNSTFPLRIEATDGDNPFETELRRSDATKLRGGGQHQPSEDEWEAVILSALLQSPDVDLKHSFDLDKVEINASLTKGQLSLVFRKKISGVIQRLGEISLRRNDDLEIDTVAWAHIAVQKGLTLSEELQSLDAKISEQSDAISSLHKQLEDLIAAKKEREADLMTKFCELINEKKLKIRDQQRLLASVKIGDESRGKITASRAQRSKAAQSRSTIGKRRRAESSASDDEEAFADADKPKREDSEDAERQQTPGATMSEDETTNDESDNNTGSAPLASLNSRTIASKTGGRDDEDVQMADDEAPPTRALPFDTKSSSTGGVSTKLDSSTLQQDRKVNEDDDETTDDDEL